MFTQAQITGYVRQGLTIVASYLVIHGYGDDALWQLVSGLILMAVPFVWNIVAHSKYGVILAAENVPGTERIISSDPDLSNNPDLPRTVSPVTAAARPL